MGEPDYKLGRLKGRWVVTWHEQNRRPRHRLSKGISASEAAAELRNFAKLRTRLLARDSKTVEDLYTSYRADRAAEHRPTAKIEFSWKALKPVFGRMAPSDITKQDCRHYVERRRFEGRAVGTAWTELSVLRAIVNWAVTEKLIQQAPFIQLPPQPEPKERHLTREEAERLLAAAVSPHIRLFIVVALATAGRSSAILELQWVRIDFERGRVNLRTAEASRNKRRAIVPMNASVRAALSEAQQGALSPFVIEWGGDRVRSIKRAFARAVERAGLGDDVTPHTLRHTAAVWMAEGGVPMSEISQYLGHSSTKVTERVYARYSPDYLRKAGATLEIGVPGGSLNRV